MPEQLTSKRITLPKLGVNRYDSAVKFQGLYTPYMKNMFLEGDILKKAGSYIKNTDYFKNPCLQGTSDESGQYIYEYVDTQGVYHLLAVTTKHIFEYDTNKHSWKCINPGASLHSCDSGWTDCGVAGFTVVHSNSEKVTGDGSLKITGTFGGTDSLLCYINFTAVDCTVYSTKMALSCWIKTSGIATGSAYLTLVASESANGAKSGTYIEVELNKCLSDSGEFFVFQSLNKAFTSMNAVVSLGVYDNSSMVAAGQQTIYIDDIQAIRKFGVAE